MTVTNPEAEQPGWDDLYEVGTAAVVHKMIRVPDGTLRILVQGVRRDPARGAASATIRTCVGRFDEVPDEGEETPEVEALDAQRADPLRARSSRLVPYLPEELRDRGRERGRPERALVPRRLDPADQDRREAAPARD